MSGALTDLENILKPVGFYRQKAKYVRDAACYIEKWGVPKNHKGVNTGSWHWTKMCKP